MRKEYDFSSVANQLLRSNMQLAEAIKWYFGEQSAARDGKQNSGFSKSVLRIEFGNISKASCSALFAAPEPWR